MGWTTRASSSDPVDKQVVFLLHKVRHLGYRIDDVGDDTDRKLRELEGQLQREVRSVSRQVQATTDNVETLQAALVGHDGAGLRLAIFGLIVTAVGVALTACSLPWDQML